MKKLFIGVVVLIIVVGVGVAMSKVKSTNCVVSDNNPYESLPMVCKGVLKNPN
jgi:hypothetical protein